MNTTTNVIYVVTYDLGEYRDIGNGCVSVCSKDPIVEEFENIEDATARYNELSNRDQMRAKWVELFEQSGCEHKGLACEAQLLETIEEVRYFDDCEEYESEIVDGTIISSETYDIDSYRDEMRED